ncbi:MAG: ABC transporter ATP-binding protein [Micrococcales bacterium]|nr:ABC transporter ATP-binding protein [Micrococcales bacterium]
MISVRSLTRRYGELVAVDNVDLEVAQGQLFAFLGPNGAGKSTTINCLTTLMPFDSGEIDVDGHRLGQADHSVRQSIGVVFQKSVLDDKLTVRENLATRAAVYGLSANKTTERINALAGQIGIGEFLGQRYGRLSGGQRRRTDIARALIHGPSILFLDEPTAGLDPKSREQVLQTVKDLRASEGVTVFHTTHYLEEVENVDHVAVINRGKIVASGTPGQLRAQFATSQLSITPAEGASEAVRQALGQWDPKQAGVTWQADVGSGTQARRLLAELGEAVADFEFRHGTMDAAFLALTQREEESA